MIRTFATHSIRKQQELTGSLWEFVPCQGEYAGRTFQVATPCCWENLSDFSDYRGEGIFRKNFYAGGTIRLELKGVSHTAKVYLDGKEIAGHYNAYTAFSVIVKDLEECEHTLEIKADNRFSSESALHIPNDYMSYGGISRPVVLEQLDELYIRLLHITPYMENEKWKARAEIFVVSLSGKDHAVDVSLSVAGKVHHWKKVMIRANEECMLCEDFVFDQVKTWEMEHPELYYAKAELERDGQKMDDLIDRFGFREIRTDRDRILLNGRAVRIKGFCRHEDHPQFGCALPYAAIAADLEMIRHLGANSIRAVHYPDDEIFLDLCDEQGILVWEENHARGLSLEDMQNPNFEPQAEAVIREMIPLHYNHPCIYIWGILNECASDSAYGKECYEKQYDMIRSLDPSRPRSSASCKFKTDLCFGLPEVVSYNIYPLWYHDTPPAEYLDDLYQWVQRETGGRGKPFLVTETGAGAIYGFRNNHHAKWTEEYQAEALEKQLTAVLEHKGCSGVYIWQFCDIRVSDEWFAGRPRTMNNKGVVDEYRRHKLSYDVVKRIFESYSDYLDITPDS